MAVQVLLSQPEKAVGLRQAVLGMVAEDEEAGCGVPRDAPVGLRAQIASRKTIQTTLQRAFPRAS